MLNNVHIHIVLGKILFLNGVFQLPDTTFRYDGIGGHIDTHDIMVAIGRNLINDRITKHRIHVVVHF